MDEWGDVGVVFDSGVGLWQEKSSAKRQSCQCEHVEHIGAVLPAPCPLAKASPAENRQRATTRAFVTG
jgi:hypothetical protein